jgi:hypothetical protein
VLINYNNRIIRLENKIFTFTYSGADWINISGPEFFWPGQKLTGDQRFGHKYAKKKK